MEQNFEKLEELIKDDDKIVTVTSFAFEARVSIAESKDTFEKYVEINKESKEINITYILNGRKKGKDYLSVSLVKDNNLEQERELYEDGVNQTIFSIQKAKNIDFNVIALADAVGKTTEKDPLPGTIIGKNCIKRVLHKKVLPTLPPAIIRGKSTIFTKQNSAVKSESQKADKDVADSNQNNKNKGSSQGSITSLFNKAAQNKKPEQKGVKLPEKKQKTNGGLSNFFTKQPSREAQNNEVKKEKDDKNDSKAELKGRENGSDETDDEILKDLDIKEESTLAKATENKEQAKSSQGKKQSKKSDLFDSDTDDEILKDLDIKEEKHLTTTREKKKEQSVSNKNKGKGRQKKKNKRGVNDVGNDKSVKKRKRIIVDESDSDDIFGSEKSDNEDVIERSDEEQEPVKVEKKPLPPKNKRRKAVDNIFEDEDGYIVTKTEYVYETPSEDENEPEKKVAKIEEKPKPKIEKKGSSNSENDISPNKGAKGKKGAKKAPSGNQPTLMNFFKKK